MNPPDRIGRRLGLAGGRVSGATGQDRGDELRHAAEAQGYRAVVEHVADLRRIESELAAAATHGWMASDRVHEQALDIIRRHMLRGMARAHMELGDRVTFWVPR